MLVGLKAENRDQAIRELVDALVDSGEIEGQKRDEVIDAIIKREASQSTGLGFGVAAVTINYRRPAGLNVVLEIRSHLKSLGAKSGVIHQDVVDTETGGAVADADVTFAVIDTTTGRAVPMSEDIRQALQAGDGR